jgi:hypothetical protein
MTNHCPVTADLNRYLAEQDRQEEMSFAVEELAERLMEKGCEYDPFSAENLSEAIGEMSAEALNSLGDFLRSSFKNSEERNLDFIYFYDSVFTYWKQKSEVEAQKIIEREIVDGQRP